jgi:phenylalanyl-tRNA synthetase alpha chain
MCEARQPMSASPPETAPEVSQALDDLRCLEMEGRAAFEAAATPEAVEAARVDFLGMKSGRLKSAQARLKELNPAGKRIYGQAFNETKAALEQAHEAARLRVSSQRGVASRLDVTLPGTAPRLGHRHPLTQTIEELIDLFARFGFSLALGPEVEDVFHNFEALNIPETHPARDPSDNFYLNTGALLRSQTSTVQIRVMEAQRPPVRIISLGRVYRPDEMDQTHSFMFHQIEGLMVDRGVTMADLKTVLRMFCSAYLGEEVTIRFRPSFFPFTEPSVEVDMKWIGGDHWVEMGGAGMVDPNVLRAVGYDPEQVTGFAFGLGIERLCMRRHQIDDIRLFYQNDARFLRQF